jgi:predicted AAA+ superfamily ATPase
MFFSGLQLIIDHMHPFSVAEIARKSLPTPDQLVREPVCIQEEDFEALWTHGGFPDPFLMRDAQFSRRWQRLRRQQSLFRNPGVD